MGPEAHCLRPEELRETRQAALFLLRPAGYLVSSTAGPAVTFRKASMACGFISLAL